MRVDQIMSTEVHTCGPEDSLERAAQLMWECDCGSIVVCTGDGTPQIVGMITDRDIAMAALMQGMPLRDLNVKNAMSREVLTCQPDDSPRDAEQRMRFGQIRRLPVVNVSGSPIGMLSLADLAQEAQRECDDRKKQITENEIGDTLAAICRPRAREASSASE